jgi:HEAT repeat protein
MDSNTSPKDHLLKLLVEGDLDAQVDAKMALAELGEPAVESLIALLEDDSKCDIWWLMADALGRIGDRRAVKPLVQLLNNPLSFDIMALLSRKYAVWALANLKDAQAVDTLIAILHEKKRVMDDDDVVTVSDEPDHEIIEAAIGALTEIGDPRAIEPIVNRLLEGDTWPYGGILAPWGSTAFELLLKALDSQDDATRATAAYFLGQFGDARAVEPLIDLLGRDASNKVRDSAAYALGELRDKRAVDALVAALKDPDEGTRAEAAFSLEKIGDERSIPALAEAVSDEHPSVRSSARQALETITQTRDRK